MPVSLAKSATFVSLRKAPTYPSLAYTLRNSSTNDLRRYLSHVRPEYAATRSVIASEIRGRSWITGVNDLRDEFQAQMIFGY